jgi:quinol monooxygenase YgiN
MIKHIVVWKLKPSAEGRTATENAAEIKARLETLEGLVPGLIKLEAGIDFSRTPASAEVVLYSEFADRQALDAYMTHPDHVAAAESTVPLRIDRTMCDYEV